MWLNRKMGAIAPTQLIGSNSIDSVRDAMHRADIWNAKAALESESGLTRGLDLAGSLAKRIGDSMTSMGMAQAKSKAASAVDSGKMSQADFDSMTSKMNLGMKGMDLLNTTTGFMGGFPMFAYGKPKGPSYGIAEGGEMIEDPMGNMGEIVGPKHENGGVPMVMHPMSQIYSDRIKIEGKSIAERNRQRLRANSRMARRMDKHPYDLLSSKASERMRSNHEKLKQMEMELQMNIL